MCGIFGQFSPQQANPELVDRMAQALAHRGPDGYAVHHEGRLAFGAGRLAIIDLSAPVGALFNEDKSISVVFNGEIYNYRELRKELEQAGHQFRTKTDTEILVHGYEEWGIVPLLNRLRGMFAFCLHDASQDCLLLARDRIGEKPLYYTRRPNGDFLFASEIKALWQESSLKAEVNREALPYYLTLGYSPPPLTMFKGIYKLAPAEYMRVSQEALFIDRYWSASMDTTQAVADYPTSVKHVREAVQNAVESRMVSDVPVGALLSGGVDSAAVVALMQKLSKEPVQTFTVGFDFEGDAYGDKKFNVDVHYAKEAAQHIGTEQHVITIQDDFVKELIPHLVYQMDEPIAQHSSIQTVYVTALARVQGIPVLLTGDAGDELFLGYPHYQADRKLDPLMRLPRALRTTLSPLLSPFKRFDDIAPKLRADAPSTRYLEWMRFMRNAEANALLMDSPVNEAALSELLDPLLARPKAAYFAERIAYASLNLWIPEDSNMRVDKMSMLMSVETRAPLEDHELVDLAFHLPLDYKLREGDFKRIFKDAVRDLLPASILTRPKWGFIPPMSDWLRTSLRPLVDTYLAPDYVEAVGLCRADVVQGLVNDHMSKRGYYLKELWALLVLHLWYALYIDKSLVLKDKLTPEQVVRASKVESYQSSVFSSQ